MFQYEYQDRDGVLVSIKPNERYILLAKTNDHWWQVRRDNSSKPFYIPAKYVKELPPDVPSPLDFGGLPDPEPMPPPATTSVPVPVPVPIPKTLEEPSWTKTKPGDEVTILLRPDPSTGYRKAENRMSTFGVPLDFQDLSPLVMPTPVHSSTSPAGPAETMTTTSSRITNMADDSKKHLSGFLEEHRDSGKHRAPSFSPADPRPQTQPIHVETPVVPSHNDLHSPSSTSRHDNQDSLMEQKEEEVEEEELNLEESTEEEEESQKDEDSNHIYESIQDLNLDVEALLGGRLSPGFPSEPAPAPPPTQVRHLIGPCETSWVQFPVLTHFRSSLSSEKCAACCFVFLLSKFCQVILCRRT